MKLKSELYVYELNLIMIGLTIQMRHMLLMLESEKKWIAFRSIFAPWTLNNAKARSLERVEAILEHAKMLGELRDKVIEAEGMDENMKPITFKEMIEGPN